MNVSDLYIYPVKSTRGQRIESSVVRARGMANDRRWIVVDSHHNAITGRDVGILSLITAQVTDAGLSLSRASVTQTTIPTPDDAHRRSDIKVWSDTVNALDAGDEAATWLTSALSTDCRLFYMDNKAKRQVVDHDSDVSFADAFPVLITNTASLQDLSERADDIMDMRRFRPNIVVDSETAFEEDTWRRIRIGEVEFEVHSPCERCNFTTLNPDNADAHPRQEPLRTLAKYRRTPEGEVCFGQNIIAINSGIVRAGDSVEVIETGPARPQALRPKGSN